MTREQMRKLEALGYDTSDEMLDIDEWDLSCFKALFKVVNAECGIISAIDMLIRMFLFSKGLLYVPKEANGNCRFKARFVIRKGAK